MGVYCCNGPQVEVAPGLMTNRGLKLLVTSKSSVLTRSVETKAWRKRTRGLVND